MIPKQYLILFLLLTVFLLPIQAQENEGLDLSKKVFDMRQLDYKLKVGFQMTGFSGRPAKVGNEKWGSKIGLMGSVVSTFTLLDRWGLDIELMLSQRGAKAGSLKRNIDYFDLPVTVMYDYVESETDWDIDLGAGLQLGYLLAAEDDNGSMQADIKKAVSQFDFGLNLVSRFSRPSTFFAERWFLECRYYIGLKNIIANTQNSMIQFSFGLDY